MIGGKLFEVSWEVCNKVGGIYTVLKSKSGYLKSHFKENYFLIGPYFPKKESFEFEEKMPPGPIKQVFNELRKEGLHCHFGRWLIPSSPNVVLIDYSCFVNEKDKIKGWLWESFGIDSLGSEYFDYDEPVLWGYSVAKFIEKFNNEPVIAHCHEWLSATALLFLRRNKSSAKLIFTTHATVLGRTLASTSNDFYNNLNKINPKEEAYRLGIHTKHLTEAAAAQNADVFTTVSEITGLEAEHFLARKPDVITPNGLDLSSFPTFEEISVKHGNFKRRIQEFMKFAFFPYYTFDIPNTLIFFTASRYEFHGKGIDMYIKALGYLNKQLKKQKKPKTILNLFWVPTGNVRGIHPEILENKTFYEDLNETLHNERQFIESRMIDRLINNKALSKSELLSKPAIQELKKKMARFKKDGLPRLCTHLIDEDNNQIIQAFKQEGLLNKKDDPVKVILYPIYLIGADGVLDMTYYECILGSHFGVYPQGS